MAGLVINMHGRQGLKHFDLFGIRNLNLQAEVNIHPTIHVFALYTGSELFQCKRAACPSFRSQHKRSRCNCKIQLQTALLKSKICMVGIGTRLRIRITSARIFSVIPRTLRKSMATLQDRDYIQHLINWI